MPRAHAVPQVLPSSDLVWHPCYAEPFQCARLQVRRPFSQALDILAQRICQVPLDYSDPTGRQAAIALIRKPATAQEDYRGPVLFNPGGPGTSGVSTVLSLGDAFATFIGPQFDIVSFDPRGSALFSPDVLVIIWLTRGF